MKEKLKREQVFSNWLNNIEGIGRKTRWKLLNRAENAYDIYNMKENELNKILTQEQYQCFEKFRKQTDPEKSYEKIRKQGMEYLPFSDPVFPERLRNIPDPPTGIYVKGELPDESRPSVAVIGARECSEYGRYAAKWFAGALADSDISVISGLARGIDGIGQETALRHGGRTYAVMGGGADICYPEENRKLYERIPFQGGILSEMPVGTLPRPGLFPQRNRIISGLADIILVVEAREKSGTLITVDMALEQGKEVAVIPGRITDRLSCGCNSLIRQGAAVVQEPSELLQMLQVRSDRQTEHMTGETKKGGLTEMDESKQKVYRVLDYIPQTVGQLCRKTEQNGDDIVIPEMMHILMELLAEGKCLQSGGYFYLKG